MFSLKRLMVIRYNCSNFMLNVFSKYVMSEDINALP